jgi:hypothetical protein
VLRLRLGTAAACVFLVAVVLWAGGCLDRPLSEVGLNRNTCVENGFGTTFCGDDAEEYCRALGPDVGDCPKVLAD